MVDFYKRHDDAALSHIPLKANKILYLLLSIILLIILRLWHLSVVQHEKKLEEAFRPRKRVIIEASERGTIRDRFNKLIAANKMEYRLSVVYSEMREIPAVIFDKTTKNKRALRKEYIHHLSQRISRETGLEADRIEDLIHSHAALYDSIPFVIKNNLSEQEYYRLKALEKDFPGVRLERYPRRYYPYGRIGSHVIGYLGPMAKERYDKIINDIRTLSAYIKDAETGLYIEPPPGIESIEDAKQKLSDLQERAYTLNDLLGVMGVEASFEETLRGYAGKQVFFSDAKGNYVRELPGSHPPISGKRVFLSLSMDLQEYAEKLLAQSERDREQLVRKDPSGAKTPLLRGGAIVAVDPKTGEVVCMASYPRFDPNDFIDRKSEDNVIRWVENDAYIAKVWNQVMPLVREEVSDAEKSSWQEIDQILTWKNFLDIMLPQGSYIKDFLSEDRPIRDIIVLQRAFDEVLKRAPAMSPIEVMKMLYTSSNKERDGELFSEDIDTYKQILDGLLHPLKDPQEKLLLLDLSRLVLYQEDFSPELIDAVGSYSIGQFRKLACRAVRAYDTMRREARKRFHTTLFAEWRKNNEKSYLQTKRKEEKEKKRYAKPYLDYLDKMEKKLFEEFWAEERYVLLSQLPDLTTDIPGDLKIPFLKSLKGYADLKAPLYHRYKGLSGPQGKHLAGSFIKSVSAGAMRSHAYRQSTIQGSIFKLVTGYAGLKQKYAETTNPSSQGLHLFDMVDNTYRANGKMHVGTLSDGKPLPQIYKGGRIPKSLHHNIGKIDLIRAIETSSNPYFSILAGDYLHDAEELANVAKIFGYGEKSGIELPGELAGAVPTDLKTNKTGLYATAIGQHTLITTPLQTAMMLAAIANDGVLLQPKIVPLIAGKEADSQTNEIITIPTLQRRQILFPEPIRSALFEGMRRSAERAMEDKTSMQRLFTLHPSMQKDFLALKGHLIGKTSTAEVIERVGLDVVNPSHMYNHTWFGGISFDTSSPFVTSYQTPDLVVVVYLRYGGYGKEAAPIAAQVVQKWRKIRATSENQ